MMRNACPSVLPPSTTTPNYNLHVNLPADLRPPLFLQASFLGPLEEFFNQSLFECVVCTGDCVSGDDIIFRLQARAIRLNDGIGSTIECLGDTVMSTYITYVQHVYIIWYTVSKLVIATHVNASC